MLTVCVHGKAQLKVNLQAQAPTWLMAYMAVKQKAPSGVLFAFVPGRKYTAGRTQLDKKSASQ